MNIDSKQTASMHNKIDPPGQINLKNIINVIDIFDVRNKMF